MASTSAPQQGSLPTEVIGQIGSLDSTQVAQILRNLPGLLNKVSHRSIANSSCVFLSLGMELASAICESGLVALIAGDGTRFRSLESHVIAFGHTSALIFPFQHNMPTAFLFSITAPALMTSCQ